MEGSPIDSELLARYIAGEADDAERGAVRSWAEASPDNAEELQRMGRIWEWGAVPAGRAEWDTDAAWQKLDARIEGNVIGGKVIPFARRTIVLRWVAAAAVLAGLAFAIQWFMKPEVERFAATDVHLDATLSDGSTVELSPGTTMEVKMAGDRNVELNGEAYFAVERDEKRPFTVSVEDVTVTVLGTAFEVSAYDTASAVLVRVRSGRVQVVAGLDTVILGAGERVHYDKARHFLERSLAPPAEVWGTRIIHFEGATLAQVADQLQRLFKVRIDLGNEAIARCTLTAEFENEPIGSILKIIAETFALELKEVDAAHYRLDGEGC